MKRFLMIMVATAVFSSAAYAQEVEPPVVAISASRLEFTPNRITLKRGQTVTLRVTSTDRIEGFSSKELGFNVDIRPDQPHDITITPEKPGRFVVVSDHVRAKMFVNIE